MKNAPADKPTKTQEPVFLQGSLMKHVSVMSFTASIGLMAIFAVDFIDMIFISMLGNKALAAAVGYAGTILFFTTSISIGLSIAAGALVAKALGAKKYLQAQEAASSVLMFGFMITVVAVGLVLTMLPNLLSFLGAEGETKRLAARYLWILIPSMPVMMAAMVSMSVLRAHGAAKRAMAATLFGGIVNAVLDPLFIFTFGLGLDGAGFASLVARFVMLVVATHPVIKIYHGYARFRSNTLKRDARLVANIATPAVLTNIAAPVGSAIVMRELAKFGTDTVAAMAIIGRLTPVAFAMVFALSGAIGPIIGQNFGNGSLGRVRSALSAGLVFSLAYVLLVAAALYFFRAHIAAIFQAKGQTLSLVFLFCGPLALAFYFNAIIFIGNAAFNNLEYPYYSTWVNWGDTHWAPCPLFGWARHGGARQVC
jgi:putative MATE family efflux protein